MVGVGQQLRGQSQCDILFRIRDSKTGTGVQGTTIKVTFPDGTVREYMTNNAVWCFTSHVSGRHSFDFSATGYRNLSTHFVVNDTLRGFRVDILLPAKKKSDRREIAPVAGDSTAVVEGYVIDGTTLQPVANAEVHIGNAYTRTDEKGHFSMNLQTFQPHLKDGRQYAPVADRRTIVVSAPGYKTLVVKDWLVVPGIQQVTFELERGAGTIEKQERHGLLDRTEEEWQKRIEDVQEQETKNTPGSMRGGTLRITDIIPLPFFAPPSTIRVGTNCACRACSSVSVMSLEDYVSAGLNDEWIASWLPHSLRAGALAYRAYGAWHVLNPVNVNYDICSTPCCQAWDSDIHINAEQAVRHTSGFAIAVRDSVVARAEYSAENNGWDDPNDNLSCVNSCPCGDGYAGSDCTGWICVRDAVCAGKGCFGHGRGMCQWGSQRWAQQGQFWDWIAFHYYNEEKGWHISRPVNIDSVWVSNDSAGYGDTLTIFFKITSYAEDTLTRILLGASLFAGRNWYSDAVHDRLVSVAPGTAIYSREFSTAALPCNTYTLTAALWFDVNENGSIDNPDDLPVDSVVLPYSVRVDGGFTVNGSVKDVSCWGGTDGAISITVSGGTPPYTHRWNNGDTTEDLSGVPAGTYTDTITDNNGCRVVAGPFTVGEPPQLVIDSFTTQDPSACGASDGMAIVHVSGGTPPYSYLWSSGATLDTARNLSAGTYTVIVADANACQVSGQVSLNDGAGPTASYTKADVSCTGASDGWIKVSPQGGTPPYTHRWNPTPPNATASGDSIWGLTEGSWTDTVVDHNGCTYILHITISEPSPISVSVELVDSASCAGSSDGAIHITVSGGTPPYSHHWSNGDTTEDLTGIPAGTYTDTITDANGCTTVIGPVTVGEPPQLAVTPDSIDPVSCAGNSDGAIYISVSGGTPPYQYLWSSGAQVEDLTGVPAGTYTITVTDRHGCQIAESFVVYQPDPLVVVIRRSASGDTLFAEVNGGTPPYNYLWSSGDTFSYTLVEGSGTYTVQVVDARGCTSADSLTVVVGGLLTGKTKGSGCLWHVYGERLRVSCSTPMEKVGITAIDGRTIRELIPSNQTNSIDIELPAGLYLLEIQTNGKVERGIVERIR